MRYAKVWLLILLLFVGDIGTTMYGLQNGYSEANPTVESAMEEYGNMPALLLFLPVKLGAALLALGGQWFAGYMDEPHRQKWFPAMVLFVLALPPVVWNLWILA